jgi:hypothetical protein
MFMEMTREREENMDEKNQSISPNFQWDNVLL